MWLSIAGLLSISGLAAGAVCFLRDLRAVELVVYGDAFWVRGWTTGRRVRFSEVTGIESQVLAHGFAPWTREETWDVLLHDGASIRLDWRVRELARAIELIRAGVARTPPTES
jgi:hypothetical protein